MPRRCRCLTPQETRVPPGTLGLYGRAALGSLPLAGRLPFVAGGGGEMPDSELVLEDVGVDTERLAEYCRVCGFTMRDAMPADVPAHPRLPASHGADDPGRLSRSRRSASSTSQNRIEQRRPIEATEKLEIRVSAGELKPHPKGRTFALLTSVAPAARRSGSRESTNLRRGKGSESASDSGPVVRRPTSAPRPSGSSRATSAGATAASRATATRSTCTG